MEKHTAKEKKIVLPNDFERMIPEYHKSSIIYGEHIVRYLSAAKLLAGKRVLDIASGSGYGTQILSKHAKHIIGVDISEDSVLYAQQNYPGKNIEYRVGDGESIPLEDKSVDVVVSFETIEHIKNYKNFMKEVKRVLVDDGLLVLSTPNDLEFAEGNHFHLHEFTQLELEKLVKESFSQTKSYFQGTWLYSALLEEGKISREESFKLDTLNAAPLKPKNYLYFFMLCSNRKISESITDFAVISEHWSARKNQEKESLTQQHITNVTDSLKAAEKYATELQESLTLKDQHIKNLESQLARIKSTIAWKVAAKAKNTLKRTK